MTSRAASMTVRVCAVAALAAMWCGGLALLVPAPAGEARGRVRLPPVGVAWDYQLGGPSAVPGDVGIVVRDRRAVPAAGRYNVCYVNAFQTQPDERSFWRSSPRRWRLVLKRDGRPVVDSAWGEWLFDIRSERNRVRLARIVGRWTDRCARDGFDAVEFDNLDSFSRSGGLVSGRDARRFARMLTGRAHAAGLAAAQKNWAELGARGPRLGFDFAVAEECGQWRECGAYRAVYGRRVLVVEYDGQGFGWACRHAGDLSVLRRDLALAPGGHRRWC